MRGKDEADAPPPESLLDSVAAAAWCACFFFATEKSGWEDGDLPTRYGDIREQTMVTK